MKPCIYLILWLWLPALAFAQRTEEKQMTIAEYITKYKDIAITEMRKHGIPASITLAQGILESNFGNSRLARQANNHFGIKCGNNWQGPTFIQDDDTEKECFRKYQSPYHSFDDHSLFLKGKERYQFLFALDPKDYKAWAHGLQKAGYATNPNYANLLIRLIEERNLDRFDHESQSTQLSKEELEYLKSLDNKVFVFNGIKTVISQPNEVPADIAAKYDISLRQLLKYNDLNEHDYLEPGSRIYLEPKRTKGYEDYHKVTRNETMHAISQKQGIRLKTLYKKNHMQFGQEPAEGEILCLKRKCAGPPKLKTDEEIKEQIKEQIQKRVDSQIQQKTNKNEYPAAASAPATTTPVASATSSSAKAEEVSSSEQPKDTTILSATRVNTPSAVSSNDYIEWNNETPPPTTESPTKLTSTSQPNAAEATALYHTVAPKETLYRIALNYKVSVDDIKKWNRLQSNDLSIGQRLIVGYTQPPPSADVTASPATTSPVQTKAVSSGQQSASRDGTPDASGNPRYHIVAPKETLYRIAVNNNISVDDLKRWNGLTSNDLFIGQRLIVGFENLNTSNDIVVIEEQEQEESEPVSEKLPERPTYHKVQQGETLYAISQRYGIAVETLRQLNNLPGNNITPGQVLKLQ